LLSSNFDHTDNTMVKVSRFQRSNQNPYIEEEEEDKTMVKV
jgi:hypothetical protein